MLKNHKLFVIGTVAALVAVVGLVVVLFGPSPIGRSSSRDADLSAATTPIVAQMSPSAPGRPPALRGGMPAKMKMMGAPGKPGAMKAKAMSMAGKPGAKQVPGKPGAPVTKTAVSPVAARPDPFLIPGTNGPIKAPQPPVASLAPTHIITNWRPHTPTVVTTGTPGAPLGPASLPGDRVAGIMMNNGVYAIMETNGQSQVVQPGDTLPGGEQVVSIQSDSVTLRTTGNQTVNLPVSAGAATSGPVGYPGTMPAAYNPGAYNPGGGVQY